MVVGLLFASCFSLSSVTFNCSASIKRLQEQNESHQVNKTRMEESMAVALEKKDQVEASFTHHTSQILCVAFLFFLDTRKNSD